MNCNVKMSFKRLQVIFRNENILLVTYVKCPTAFDVLGHYVLTNFIREPKFKITCFVGWIKYNSEKSSSDLLCWRNCGEGQ